MGTTLLGLVNGVCVAHSMETCLKFVVMKKGNYKELLFKSRPSTVRQNDSQTIPCGVGIYV